jgi:hypothetical protein
VWGCTDADLVEENLQDMSLRLYIDAQYALEKKSILVDVLLMIDFVNLKIKLSQSFRIAHRIMVYIYRGECSYMYKYLITVRVY